MRSQALSAPAKSSLDEAMTDVQSAIPAMASASAAALSSLSDLLDAFDTLPCIKYVAGVAVKILRTIDEIQTTERELQLIGLRSRNIVIAIAKSCKGAGQNLNDELQGDLSQLTETMGEILRYVQELSSRSKLTRVFFKAQDATAMKSLDTQLMHAFQIFTIQSSVHLRVSQEQMMTMLKGLSVSSEQPPLQTIKHARLIVPSGLYLIRSNNRNGGTIENAHVKSSPMPAHAYVAPHSESISPYQLWVISFSGGNPFRYVIRNFATGELLDRGAGGKGSNHVACWTSRGVENYTWEFLASRQTETAEYCYIRGCNSRLVMDAKCPSGRGCNYLHMTEQSVDGPLKSQEWCLLRFSWSSLASFASPNPAPSALNTTDLPRRQFLLQNVASGGYATAIGLSESIDTPNLVLRSDAASATRWFFLYQKSSQQWTAREDVFAIVTRTLAQLATLDHFYMRNVQATYRRFMPQKSAHNWHVVPSRNGGAFVFANRASGKLLAQARTASPLAMLPASEAEDDTCHWRLIDATSGEVCRVLYDSKLTIAPPELAGPSQAAVPVPGATDAQKVLRTKSATSPMQTQFAEGLKREHEVIRQMLRDGYTSLVVAPQLVRGCKGENVHEVSVAVRSVEDGLGAQRLCGKGVYNFERCEPK